MSAGNRPCLTLSGDRGIQISIWKNRSRKGNDYFSFKISRRYLPEGSSEWQTTDNFLPCDLPILAALCEIAYGKLGVREFGPGLMARANFDEPTSASEPTEETAEAATPF